MPESGVTIAKNQRSEDLCTCSLEVWSGVLKTIKLAIVRHQFKQELLGLFMVNMNTCQKTAANSISSVNSLYFHNRIYPNVLIFILVHPHFT